MRSARWAVIVLLGALTLGACGGSSAPAAGQVQAAAACKTGGANAANLASQASQVNSRFAKLAVDEHALAASESSQDGELNDGDSSDDSGLGALTQADSLGSTADLKVVGDCVALGLSVTAK
jgi:hypothetical protein